MNLPVDDKSGLDVDKGMSVTIATILPEGSKPFAMIPRGGSGDRSNKGKRMLDEDGLGLTFRFLDGTSLMRQ